MIASATMISANPRTSNGINVPDPGAIALDVDPVLELPELLLTQRDQHGADDRAGDAAGATDDQHRHDEESLPQVEVVRRVLLDEVRPERPAQPGRPLALSVQAIQRVSAALTPMLAAAASSSREARSLRPTVDSLKAKAMTTTIAAQVNAVTRSVSFGMPSTVRDPRVSSAHCSATRLTTIRRAKVAIVNDAPRNRTSATPISPPKPRRAPPR